MLFAVNRVVEVDGIGIDEGQKLLVVAAPRFGMFCASVHKTLPVAEKKKYREKHLAKTSS